MNGASSLHPRGSPRAYAIGFGGSVALTLAAFLVAVNHAPAAIIVVAVCALAQTALQLTAFLHVTTARESRWRLQGVLFIVVVVSILAGGTLWIMSNLVTRTAPQQMQYMQQQSGL